MLSVRELLNKHKIFFFEKQNDFQIKCLNPEHDDNNPSMHVQKETGAFICFSCGFSGGFAKLAKTLGEEIDASSNSIEIKAALLKKKLGHLYTSHEHVIVETPRGAKYYKGSVKNISSEILIQYKCFTANTEEYVNRFWFPIYHLNKLIAFQGRSELSNLKPKWKFLPEHTFMKPVVYGIDSVPGSTVVLTEGILDALMLRTAGINEGCSIFGSHIPAEKIHTLATYNIDTVILLFDGDDAGRKATLQALKMLKKHLPHALAVPVYLPEETDPGDMTVRELQDLANSEPMCDYLRRTPNETE